MKNTVETKIIAHIHNDFKEKFGIPRQSGIADDNQSVIVFEKEYRDENALREIENFSHLWLIWYFSKAHREKWSPTVRPPRLGGNKRVGVFATRSPFRPNPIGLSSVKLCEVKKTKEYGTVLIVTGADLLDGTPIFDIKPYLSFSDSHPDAICGFAEEVKDYHLQVNIPESASEYFSDDEIQQLKKILANDPRPAFVDSPSRIFHMRYGNFDIDFMVENTILTVTEIRFFNTNA